ncbi:MAG: hypothetical protein R3C11_16315 [Planctomycetaceae bacterium]
MSTIDDSQLIQLAADRPEPVLILLKRAEAFKPLVFVLALIPGLLVIQYDQLTRSDAQFVLQCLEAWDQPLTGQFSLPEWMTGLSLQLTELSLSWRFLLPSYFFGVMLVLVFFLLTQTMLNSRSGLIISLLLLMHPRYIDQLTHQVTPICAMTLMMLSLWGYQRHLLQSTIFSPYLLIGAVAGGLNMFVSPAFTYLLLSWLAIDTTLIVFLRYLVPTGKATTSKSGAKNSKEAGMGHSLRFRLISLGGLGAIIAASGLFVLSLRWVRAEDLEFTVPKLLRLSWEEERLFFAFMDSTSFLIGFIVVGMIVCLRSFFQLNRIANSQRFWIIGFVLSGFIWLSLISRQRRSVNWSSVGGCYSP